MAKIYETIKIKVETQELEHVKDIIKEIKKLGVKKKTLNMLIKCVAMAAEEIEPIEPIVIPKMKITEEQINMIRSNFHKARGN